jgi:hypothetical protein
MHGSISARIADCFQRLRLDRRRTTGTSRQALQGDASEEGSPFVWPSQQGGWGSANGGCARTYGTPRGYPWRGGGVSFYTLVPSGGQRQTSSSLCALLLKLWMLDVRLFYWVFFTELLISLVVLNCRFTLKESPIIQLGSFATFFFF